MARRLGSSPAAEELRTLRRRAGLSMAQLARLCGYKGASSLQRYESAAYGTSFLPLDLVERLASALAGRGNPPISNDEIYELAGAVPIGRSGRYAVGPSQTVTLPRTAGAMERHDEAALPPNVTPAPHAHILTRADMPLDVKVFGTAVGGKSGDFQMNGEVVDYVRRPPGVAGVPEVFAIFCQGESMTPWRKPGDLVYLHPSRPARPGDHVVVEMKSKREGEPGRAYLKLLVAKGPTKLRLAQYNPPDDRIEIDLAKVKAIYRVIDWPELLGI